MTNCLEFVLRDEAHGAAQRMTRHIEFDKRGMSEYATQQFARQTNHE